MNKIVKRIPLPEELKDVPGIKMELALKHMFNLLAEQMQDNVLATKEDWSRITKYIESVCPEYKDLDKRTFEIHWINMEILIRER